MSATPRQKACIACAESKRKCDKQLPECQRCLDRDVDCTYPQTKRRRRNLAARVSQIEALPALQNYADADALGSSLEFGNWDAIEAADLEILLPSIATPYIPILSPPIASLSASAVTIESGDVSTPIRPWFLGDETWVMQHCDQEPADMNFLQLGSFVRTVDGMLQFWVKNGHNSFIHRRLYEKGMPTCLQDAFITFAAYTGRTSAVTETILQIAEERSSALAADQSLPIAGGVEGIQAHLARVQALFVYEFIRLFDGSVRVRASAEQQLVTLRRWASRMWEAVKQCRWDDSFLSRRPLQGIGSEFDREYDASSKMWRLWILTESVRRSHLVIDAIDNIYQVMTKGWTECAGAVMFTARRGLWEVESAAEWVELSCAKPPLLVPSLQPGALMAEYTAEDLDDFAKVYWKFIVGVDKIQYWIDRSNKTSGV